MRPALFARVLVCLFTDTRPFIARVSGFLECVDLRAINHSIPRVSIWSAASVRGATALHTCPLAMFVAPAALLAPVALAILSRWHVSRSVRRQAKALHQLCTALPKAELHAHLHGCARLSTIAELAPADVDSKHLRVGGDDDRSLEACFEIFGAIHKTVTSVATVLRIANEVLSDFASDNVKYLELRTTPRDLNDADAEGYVRALLSTLQKYEASQRGPWPMTVRLILSIDRSGSAERAMSTVRLLERLWADPTSGGRAYIVGVDFSGNPTRSCFSVFVPAFEAARQLGLKVAVHSGEIDHAADTAAILKFRPDRLGHALLLSPSDVATLRAAPIPIELCPTSNLKTLRLAGLQEHPTMALWLQSGYPVSISTDDSSVFSTTSSRELALAAQICALSAEEVVQLARAPHVHAFDLDAESACQRLARFDATAAELLSRYHAGELG